MRPRRQSIDTKLSMAEAEVVLSTFLDLSTPGLREAYIVELRRREGNVTRLAKDYYIPRSTVHYHLKVFGINPKEYRDGVYPKKMVG